MPRRGIAFRKLGKSGLVVPSLGLGCMGMSEFYGRTDQEESLATIRRAVELGITFLDTADMYGPCAIKGQRNKVILVIKFGNVRGVDGSFKGINCKAEYVRTACEASFKKLGTDRIDLNYQHRVDRSVPIEETVGAMAALVREGNVRYPGLSEAASSTIRRANKVHPISALQTEYSLWARDPEDEVLPTVRELGIRFVAHSPLGRGFLTGRFRRFEDIPENDYRRNSPRFQGKNFKKNLGLVDRGAARTWSESIPQRRRVRQPACGTMEEGTKTVNG